MNADYRAGAVELPLAPLRTAREELTAHRAWLLRLCHALGGELTWFRRSVWPLLLDWERRVAGLPTPESGVSALACVLAQAAAAAEQSAADPDAGACSRRLTMAARAALRQAARCSASVQLRAGGGEQWDPRQSDLRAWRKRVDGPQYCRLLAEPGFDDRCGHAAHQLVMRGIWHDQQPRGRWLACAQGWALLWPLAGRDLLAALTGSAFAPASGATDSERSPASAARLQPVLEALSAAGYLPGGVGILAAQRADGRPIAILPVAPRLRRRCGLSSALPPKPLIALAASPTS